MEDDFLTGPIACCSVLRVNAPVQPRRPSTLTLVLIRRWTHLIPPSPLIPPLFQRPHVPIQILIRKWTKLTSLPIPPISPHGFNYDISKTSLLYRLSLICFWHLRTLSKNRTNERTKGFFFIVQELCESRGGRPGLSVLTSLLVSVDVKIY